ncbi:MAG TPA: CoA transferase [Dehalococcoidia bacterium]|jgi:crotonobetainyl-CoA:carnitine CoA-transferase CaiB-like acyl-CoA transferase
MNGPLDGVQVLEVANWLAGPTAAALLGDMGAQVIKIEPPSGDAWRGLVSTTTGSGQAAGGPNWSFEMDNRGKRSATVNLNHPAGRAIIQQLAERADVFITNLSPARAERYTLTYPTLSARNPRLIYAWVTAYGAEGPDRDRLGFDFTAYWARSGMMHLLGDAGAPPMLQRGGMGDHTTALAMLSGILAALIERGQSGLGQEVRCSLLNTGAFVLSGDLQTALVTGQDPPKRDAVSPPNPIQQRYQCADGRWLLLNMPQSDPYWPKVCRALDRPDLIDDVRCATFGARAQNSREICAIIAGIIATAPLDAWTPRFEAQGVIWAPVALPTEVIADPQAHANRHFATIEHPTLGRFQTVDIPIRFGRSHVTVRGPAPEVGQHTEEVLSELGHTWSEIAALRAAGAI